MTGKKKSFNVFSNEHRHLLMIKKCKAIGEISFLKTLFPLFAKIFNVEVLKQTRWAFDLGLPRIDFKDKCTLKMLYIKKVFIFYVKLV